MITLNIDKNNSCQSKIEGLNIYSRGMNNLLVIHEDCSFENSSIRFSGSNAVVVIDKNTKKTRIKVDIFSDSALYIGQNIFFNTPPPIFIISEHAHCILGSDCILSFGIYFRTSDAHPIYNIDNGERINFSKSIFIGDHVWIGQNCLILKGTKIGSGSIIGGNSVISNKLISSNSIWAGNPARLVKSKCTFLPICCHNHCEIDTISTKTADIQKYIYEGINIIPTIDTMLSAANSAQEKKSIIIKMICENRDKNRFSI